MRNTNLIIYRISQLIKAYNAFENSLEKYLLDEREDNTVCAYPDIDMETAQEFKNVRETMENYTLTAIKKILDKK